jgi:hypothetical protein
VPAGVVEQVPLQPLHSPAGALICRWPGRIEVAVGRKIPCSRRHIHDRAAGGPGTGRCTKRARACAALARTAAMPTSPPSIPTSEHFGTEAPAENLDFAGLALLRLKQTGGVGGCSVRAVQRQVPPPAAPGRQLVRGGAPMHAGSAQK